MFSEEKENYEAKHLSYKSGAKHFLSSQETSRAMIRISGVRNIRHFHAPIDVAAADVPQPRQSTCGVVIGESMANENGN